MLDLDQADEIGSGIGQGAETVDHLCRHRFDLSFILGIIQSAVERHANRQVRHIVLWDHDWRVDGDLRTDFVALCFKAHIACLCSKDRVLKHGLIELKTDFANVA